MHWPSLVVVIGGAISGSASATRLRKTPHRHLKEATVGQCGKCKDAQECPPGAICVSAAESGCFNFNVGGTELEMNSYCAPAPQSAAPTETPTLAPVAGMDSPIDADNGVVATEGDSARSNTTAAPSVVIPAATSAPTDVVEADTSALTLTPEDSDTTSAALATTDADNGVAGGDISSITTSAIPTGSPITSPTASPTTSPSTSPTTSPTAPPTNIPSASPITSPTASPTKIPTASPTNIPTGSPTMGPTASPTTSPTALPTTSPTASPTNIPTGSPTTSPTASPTTSPTAPPTCDSSSGVESYGPINTAPSYEDCYFSGCPDQTASRCNDSSQCGTGACCMPTRYGSYCVEAEPLFRLNKYMRKYIAPECRCRIGTVVQAAAGGAIINDGGATADFGDNNNNDANNKGDQELQPKEEEAGTVVGGSVDNDTNNKGDQELQPQEEEAVTVVGDDGGGEGAAGSSSDGATGMTVGAAVLGVASTILLGLF